MDRRQELAKIIFGANEMCARGFRVNVSTRLFLMVKIGSIINKTRSITDATINKMKHPLEKGREGKNSSQVGRQTEGWKEE